MEIILRMTASWVEIWNTSVYLEVDLADNEIEYEKDINGECIETRS